MPVRRIVFVALWFFTSLVQAQTPAAPPRSVADILAILDQYKPDEQMREQLRLRTAAPPPDTKHEQELAIFYHRRGRNNGEAGNAKQQIADLEKALSLVLPSGITEKEGIGDRNRILLDLIGATAIGGNGVRAIELASQLTEKSYPWHRFWGHFWLTVGYSFLGDATAAKRHLGLMDQSLASLRTVRDWSLWGDNWQLHADRAHGFVLELTGNYGEAERRFRRSLELAEKVYWRAFELRKISMYAQTQWGALNGWSVAEALLAKNLSLQGRLSEAESYARNSLMRQLQVSGRYSHYIAYPVQILSSILLESGRNQEAAAIVEKAIESSASAGVLRESPILAESRKHLGTALVAQYRWSDADGVFQTRDRDLALDQSQYALKNGDDPEWAIALLNAGLPEKSLAMSERIYRKRLASGFDDKEYFTAQVRGFYAMALAATGSPGKALTEFRGAIEVLLDDMRRRGGSEQGGAVARQMRMVWILEAYMKLLVEQRDSPLLATAGIDAAAEAFRIADVARGSAVQRALAESAARATPGDPALADLARREQDAQQRFATLSDLLNRLLSAPPAQRLEKVIGDLRRDIDALRKEKDSLKAELDKRFPDYADLIAPKPVTLAQTQAALRDGEALISIYIGVDRSYVWAVPKTGRTAFAEVRLGEADVARRVAHLRKALDIGEAALSDMPRFDMAKSHELYHLLLEPVEAVWQGARNLVIVPHKALGQLPFAVLTTAASPSVAATQGATIYAAYRQTPWLIRRAALTQLPSVSTLLALRRMPAVTEQRQAFIGFGDPLFSPAMAVAANDGATTRRRLRNLGIGAVATKLSAVMPEAQVAMPAVSVENSAGLAQLSRLPDTAEEIGSIARALGADAAKDVYLGRAANETNVKSGRLDNRKVVMFATHGLVPGDLNGLTQPALALSAPEVTGNKNEDGLLTMEEVLGLKLNADWVVLSACNTASGDGAGSEAVSGLGKAFFFAGARTLLVSNWPVETVSAKLLTTRLFEAQVANPNVTRAEALRTTMLELLDKTDAAEVIDGKRLSYAHPMFWAPFSLVGDGGR